MKKIAIIGFVLLVISCPALFADTLAFDNNIWSLRPTTINGEVIGAYPMHLNVNGSMSTVDLWCITYQISPDWAAFAVHTNTTDYGAQAYVLSKLGSSPLLDNQTIQWALWYLLSSDLVTDPAKRYKINGLTAQQFLAGYASLDWVQAAIALAQDGYAHPLTSGYEVYVDETNKYQSFIHLVPEPSLLLLLGIGIGAVGLTALKRKN